MVGWGEMKKMTGEGLGGRGQVWGGEGERMGRGKGEEAEKIKRAERSGDAENSGGNGTERGGKAGRAGRKPGEDHHAKGRQDRSSAGANVP